MEFTDGEMKDIIANVVAERIHAQCDEELNYVLLIDSFFYLERRSKRYCCKINN